MRTILFIFFLSSSLWGVGVSQKYTFKDPKLDDEFGNVYKYLGAPAQFVDVYPLTKAQILGSTPQRAGRLYYCSDCATDAVCVSTGTGLGAFGRISARTTACQ